MKKGSIIFSVCVLSLCLLAGVGSRIKPTMESITKDSDKSVSEIGNVSVDSKSEGVPGSIQADASKESDKTGREAVPTAAPAETDSSNSQEDHYGANLGYFCITDENNEQIVQPKINGALDLDKDGTISSADYGLSGMSRKEFADKLVSNGNVGTSKEAEMVIDGKIAVMCGIIN